MWVTEEKEIDEIADTFKITINVDSGEQAYGSYTPDNCFTFDDATGTITGYTCETQQDILIPSTINGVTVKAIGNNAFKGKLPKGLYIPNTVITIGANAFDSNSATNYSYLKMVHIPSSVTTIGASAFKYNQINSLTLQDGLTTVGNETFRNNYLPEIYLPKTLVNWNNMGYEFADNNIRHIVMEPGSTIFGGRLTFYNNKVKTINIPNTVTTIGSGVLNKNLMSDFDAFIYARNNDGSINTSRVASYGGANKDAVVVPKQVTTLGETSFRSCGITAITLNEGLDRMLVDSLSDNNFSTLTIPSTVTLMMEGTIDQSLISNHNAVATIVNKTGRDFNWQSILEGGDYTALTASKLIVNGKTTDNKFITGSVQKMYSAIITSIVAG